MASHHDQGNVQIDFCTLGMFIIDEIHFSDARSSVHDVIGGAGSYAALGARLFSPSRLSKSVGWIVDRGSDFPESADKTIRSWDTSCLIRPTPDRLTTRGWNEYGENEYRGLHPSAAKFDQSLIRQAFKYLSPKLRLDATSCSSLLIRSRCFHLICSSVRCMDMVNGILARRQRECPELKRPLFVWEPVPDLCTPQELESCYRVLKSVDVVSPNHVEIAAFFGQTGEEGGQVDQKAIKHYASRWLQEGIGITSEGKIVIRCGKEGCYAADKKESLWLPAYHNANSGKVIDPTGGGNAFLGAMSIAFARGSKLRDAAVWGSVGASFAIEQIGMPMLKEDPHDETWNDASVTERLSNFESRIC